MKRYASLPITPPRVHLGVIHKGYSGTRETIEKIKNLINKGARDFYVRQQAIDILMQKGVPPKAYLKEIQTLFQWVQMNIRYTKDPHNVEVLHSARRMLQLRAGDCDDIAILLGSMLESVGHPVRLILTGPDPRRSDLFSHVLLEVNYCGRWISLDATMPHDMGWSPSTAQRRIFSIDKEVKMPGTSEGIYDETQGVSYADNESLGEEPGAYTYAQTVDGLGNLEEDLYGAITSVNIGLRRFARRLLQQGVRPRDPGIRSVYNLLRSRQLVGQRSFGRRFLVAAWRRGMPPQSQHSQRFIGLLRSWGLISLPGMAQRQWYGGMPVRYPTLPWGYRRPPVRYRTLAWRHWRPPVVYRRRIIPVTQRTPYVPAQQIPAPPVVRTAQTAIPRPPPPARSASSRFR